jgi:hypothetical protein
MDWDRVIERNIERLFTIVATLVSMVRAHGGGVAAFLPRHVYSAAPRLQRRAHPAAPGRVRRAAADRYCGARAGLEAETGWRAGLSRSA